MWVEYHKPNQRDHCRMDPSPETRRHRTARWFQVAGIVVGGLFATGAVLQTSAAAFTATTDDGSNSFAAGTVQLVDDDSDSVMFNVSNMVPGDVETECITVTYTGSSYSVTPVKLYAALDTNVDNFADHLDVTVEEGTGGSFGDCTGFTSEATLINNETLSALAGTYTDFASGASGFTPVSGTTAKTYKFSVTLGDDTPDTSQGDSASATFTWEVQSA